MTEREPVVPLAPPAAADGALESLLRRCVQCGLCLPSCATWLVTGDETLSPRGRLLLLGEWLAQPAQAVADDSWREALDTCIGCRACSTACPSGVPHELLEAGAAAARAAGRRDGLARRLPDDARRLRALGAATAAGRRALALVLGPHWRRRAGGRGPAAALGRLARLVGSVPRAPRSDRELLRRLDGLVGEPATRPGRLPPAAGGQALLWFRGCANEGLLPDSSRRMRELLRWAGADLREAADAGCCGALADHGGRPERAAGLRRRNLAAWSAAGKVAAIVTEAAGCGAAIGACGAELPAPQVDAIAWLGRRPGLRFGTVPLRVALHDPCHARHGQGIVREPRDLLRAIPGLVLLEPEEADVCCGSGGPWAVAHAGLSAEAGLRKAAFLAATGADLVVTANPGCLGQIADGLACLPGDVPQVLPLGDLLWYAALRGCGARQA